MEINELRLCRDKNIYTGAGRKPCFCLLGWCGWLSFGGGFDGSVRGIGVFQVGIYELAVKINGQLLRAFIDRAYEKRFNDYR